MEDKWVPFDQIDWSKTAISIDTRDFYGIAFQESDALAEFMKKSSTRDAIFKYRDRFSFTREEAKELLGKLCEATGGCHEHSWRMLSFKKYDTSWCKYIWVAPLPDNRVALVNAGSRWALQLMRRDMLSEPELDDEHLNFYINKPRKKDSGDELVAAKKKSKGSAILGAVLSAVFNTKDKNN